MTITGKGNRFLVLPDCRITTYGITQCLPSECHVEDRGDPNRAVNVYTPESAMRDPLFIRSLQNIPFVNDHYYEPDDRDFIDRPDGVLFGATYAQPWVRGHLRVFTRSMRAALESGKKCLSLAYDSKFVAEQGVYEGVPYEAKQTDMRAIYLALVDEGRVRGAEVVWP